MKRLFSAQISTLELVAVSIVAIAGLSLVTELLWPHRLEVPGAPSPTVIEERESDTEATQHETSELSYGVIAAHPLFTVDRKPYALPPPEPPKPPPVVRQRPREPEITFELSAVIRTPATNIALVSVAGNPDVHRLRPGQTLEGWRLSEVAADAIRLERNGRQLEVKLDPEKEE